MFSILWSDHNKVLIYRNFVEFKRLQRDLKIRFPLEAGAVSKSERTLPKLKGWWLVENEDRQIAWFPAPYFQEERNCEAGDNTMECQEEGMCVVTKGYEAQNSDELTVMVGVVVKVLKKSDNGWWLVSYNRRTGYVPSLYLKTYTNPCEKIKNFISKECHKSTPNLYGDMYSFLHQKSSVGDQGLIGITLEERLRSQSLDSVARSDADSDIDSMTGSRRNSSYSESSSLNNSNPSLAESTSSSVLPKVPPRPNPNQIIEKCSTVTKKRLQTSLASLENSGSPGTRL
ncbi:hypothetical protein AB205_0193750 [Aquarana catesbeiana]|uniref:SH3 domain-containing protein n=1 Tax=Aquarana catesbeiana TaxID=8400 RepID=A0A2G9RFL2_AQUCT|nr:hypothetical protein AB205_0193750 [Aquarana catesbeiana]